MIFKEEDFETDRKKFEKKFGKNIKYVWNKKKIKKD